MVPACSMGSGATVNAPFTAVPFRPSSVHAAAVSSRRKRPLVVEQPCAQLDGLPGLEHHFGGRDLQMRGRALTGGCRLVDGKAGDRPRLPRTDGIDGVARHEENAAARDGRAAENLFRRPFGATAAVDAVRQFHFAEHFGSVGVRPDDVERPAVGADIDLAVGQYRRRLLRRAERLRPQFLARLDVERLQPRTVVDLIQTRSRRAAATSSRTLFL